MNKPFSRTTALIAGTIIMLINGVIYAWSIYSIPFGQGFGWTSAQLGMCFTIMLACFCLGGVIGGAFAARWGVGFSIPAGGVLACRCCVCSCRRTGCGCSTARLPLRA